MLLCAATDANLKHTIVNTLRIEISKHMTSRVLTNKQHKSSILLCTIHAICSSLKCSIPMTTWPHGLCTIHANYSSLKCSIPMATCHKVCVCACGPAAVNFHVVGLETRHRFSACQCLVVLLLQSGFSMAVAVACDLANGSPLAHDRVVGTRSGQGSPRWEL